MIAGARCAGSATALLLARMGHDVALVDRSVLPSDTLSTHAIARSGVVQLSRWGLLDHSWPRAHPRSKRSDSARAETLPTGRSNRPPASTC